MMVALMSFCTGFDYCDSMMSKKPILLSLFVHEHVHVYVHVHDLQ